MSSKKKENKNIVKNKIKDAVKKPITKITVESKTLTHFINAVATCNNEVRVTASDKALHVQTVDSANVMMLIADCECTSEIPEGALTKFGIDVAILKKILVHSKDCRVTLCVDGEHLRAIYGRFTAKIPISDENVLRKDPTLPKMPSLDTEFEMPGKYLNEISRFVGRTGRIILSTKNGVVFAAAEDGDLCIREVVGTCKKSSQARSLYSNEYIRSIAGIVKTTEIKVTMGIDHPVKILSEQDGCKLEYLLTPRIEAD